jgi:hypothetical protein
MPASIQQYQIEELGSPQSSRLLEVIGRIDANAVTPQDTRARVAGRLVGIDEENFLVIENRAGSKWWWLVHAKLRKPTLICGNLGRIFLPGGMEVKRNGKAPTANWSFNLLRRWTQMIRNTYPL